VNATEIAQAIKVSNVMDITTEDTVGIILFDEDGETPLDRGVLNDRLFENTETQLVINGLSTVGAATREQWLAGTGRTYLYLLRNGTQVSYPITLVDA